MGYPTENLFNTIKDDTVSLAPVCRVSTERVLERTMERVNRGVYSGRRQLPIRKLVLVAVIVTVLLGTTAFAAQIIARYEKPEDMLNMAFGNVEFQGSDGSVTEESYYENVYNIVQPTVEQPSLDEEVAKDLVSGVQQINQSVTYQDGTTLTVISHLHDPVSRSGVFYCTIENSKGVTGYYTQGTGELSFGGEQRIENLYVSPTCCRQYLIPGETTDTFVSLACYYIMTKDSSNIWVTQYKNKTVGISLDLTKFTASEQWQSQDGTITVTPTGIVLRVEDIDALGYGARDLANMDTLVIRFRDGSKYLVEENTDETLIINSKYWLIVPDRETGIHTAYGIFNRLVDVDQIQQAEINGVPIP